VSRIRPWDQVAIAQAPMIPAKWVHPQPAERPCEEPAITSTETVASAAKFIFGGRGWNRVCVIEIEKIKALAEHEFFAHPITAGPDKGCVVAAGAHQIRSRDLKFPTVLEMHGNSYLLTNKASRLSPRRGHNGH